MLLIALVCVAVVVTTPIYDADVWQHLLVGKAIWQLHRVPTTQLWTWPTHGAPDVNSSWGFRAILWPFWKAGATWGLYTLRWLLTLCAFGVMWAAARRTGTRGLAATAVLVACALIYRYRAQIRPEILVGMLIALEVWILETRRNGGPDRAPWLVLIAWVWANCHVSYHMGLYLIGVHLLAATIDARRGGRTAQTASPGRLGRVLLAAVAISFVNPFGWRALAQPFDFFFRQRPEPIFRTIAELQQAPWPLVLQSGLGVLMAAWILLALRRARRRGWDLVELAMLIPFAWLALSVNRFLGYFALVAVPYLARDLDDWVGSRSWPRWTAPMPNRVALAGATCLALAGLAWTRPGPLVGIGIRWRAFPVRACDFIEAHGVRGRAFNHLNLGGYLLWRFWPDHDRLPFMDIHQAGTQVERDLYMMSFSEPQAWGALRDRYGIGWTLLWRTRALHDHLMDYLDADTTFALVFVDDVAAVYVRRGGRLAAVADSFAYRVLPAGQEHLAGIIAAAETDSGLRTALTTELEREVQSSPYTAYAHGALAHLATIESRWADARAHLERALAEDPSISWLHERMATVALHQGRPAEAIRELELGLRALPRDAGIYSLLGDAHRALGDRERARRAYRSALELDPGERAAAEGLDSLRVP